MCVSFLTEERVKASVGIGCSFLLFFRFFFMSSPLPSPRRPPDVVADGEEDDVLAVPEADEVRKGSFFLFFQHPTL